MTSAVAPKLNADELNFKWGNMPPQDIPGQLTRSMLEMRKPKAYELKELPSLPLHVHAHSRDSNEVRVPACPVLQHSIKLLMYIRQAKSLICDLDNKSYAMYGQANKVADLSTPPPFQPNELPRKGGSKGFETGAGKTSPALFVAPELDNQFRDGMGDFSFPPISQDAATTLLKESVQAIAAHAGYEEMTTSCLNGLTGITRNFLENFSKRMRDALDREAETGCPPFYDVLDEVLNYSGTKSLKDLGLFWNLRVVQRHKSLEKRAMALSKEVRSLSYRVGEVDVDAVQVTQSKFGKWTPVVGMRSGSDIGQRRDPAVTGRFQQSIKSEHRDNNYMDMPDPFTDRKPSQESPFDFDDGMDSTFGLGELDNHHIPKKKSRNAL